MNTKKLDVVYDFMKTNREKKHLIEALSSVDASTDTFGIDFDVKTPDDGPYSRNYFTVTDPKVVARVFEVLKEAVEESLVEFIVELKEKTGLDVS